MNSSYQSKKIDNNILSVHGILEPGDVVTAEVWTSLWNLVINRINHIDVFCTSLSDIVQNWTHSTESLLKTIDDFNNKYDALNQSFIHYGEAEPTNPHVRLWAQRVENSDRLVTYAEMVTIVNNTANTVFEQLNQLKDICFNKTTAADRILYLTDIAPFPHDVCVKLSGNGITDYSNISLYVRDSEQDTSVYKPYADGTLVVSSSYPELTIYTSENVNITATYKQAFMSTIGDISEALDQILELQEDILG